MAPTALSVVIRAHTRRCLLGLKKRALHATRILFRGALSEGSPSSFVSFPPGVSAPGGGKGLRGPDYPSSEKLMREFSNIVYR